MRLEAAAASKQQLTSEKETKLLQERGRRLEAEIAGLKSDIEKGLSYKEVLNARLSQKDQEMEALKRSIEVHTKALERGESKYNESLEDLRILKLEIRQLRYRRRTARDYPGKQRKKYQICYAYLHFSAANYFEKSEP